MPIFEWSEMYLLGMQQIDEHHQHLVTLLNRTYDLFINNEPKEILIQVIEDLIDYATYHFSAEELLMKENKYPRLEEHIIQHDQFSKRVLEFQTGYLRGDNSLTLAVLSFLKTWLSNHILVSDKNYGYFVTTHSGRF